MLEEFAMRDPSHRPSRPGLGFTPVDASEDVERPSVKVGTEPAVVSSTDLSQLQRKIVRLPGIPQSVDDT